MTVRFWTCLLPAALALVALGCSRYAFDLQSSPGADLGAGVDLGAAPDMGVGQVRGTLSTQTTDSNYVLLEGSLRSGCPPQLGASPECLGPIACDPGDAVVSIPTGSGGSVWLASIGMDCSDLGEDFSPQGATYRPPRVGSQGLRSEARFTATCPAGTLLIGVDLRTTYAFISVRGRCLEPSQIFQATEISPSVQLSTVAGYDSATDVWQRAECPPGSVVTGFARAGTTLAGTNQYVAIDGLALQCRALVAL